MRIHDKLSGTYSRGNSARVDNVKVAVVMFKSQVYIVNFAPDSCNGLTLVDYDYVRHTNRQFGGMALRAYFSISVAI